MLDSIKTMIKELPELPFDVFYQEYICDVQDQNVQAEIATVQTDEIISLNKLIDKLRKAQL